jgi:hypothetical protein
VREIIYGKWKIGIGLYAVCPHSWSPETLKFEVIFWTPNITWTLQPMGQGLTKTLSLTTIQMPTGVAYKVNTYIGFEVHTAVAMKSSICRDITLCSQLKVNRRCGGTRQLNVKGRRISQARKYLLPASSWFLAWLYLRPWRLKWHVPPKRRLTFNGLHGVISQKTGLFKATQSDAFNNLQQYM